MPKVSIRAVQAALEANKNPHHNPDSTFFESAQPPPCIDRAADRGKPEEVALTSGASAGVAAVAYALTWKPGRRSYHSEGDFRCICNVETDGRARGTEAEDCFSSREVITADDLIAAITPMDADGFREHGAVRRWLAAGCTRVAAACHAQGALLYWT